MERSKAVLGPTTYNCPYREDGIHDKDHSGDHCTASYTEVVALHLPQPTVPESQKTVTDGVYSTGRAGQCFVEVSVEIVLIEACQRGGFFI